MAKIKTDIVGEMIRTPGVTMAQIIGTVYDIQKVNQIIAKAKGKPHPPGTVCWPVGGVKWKTGNKP